MFQVAAYENAVEVQTLDELRALKSSPDRHKLGFQSMLIRERVLGKQNVETSSIIRHNTVLYADEERFDKAVQLLFHIFENLSDVDPFKDHDQIDDYGYLLTYLLNGEDIDGPGATTFSHALKSLQWALSDFERGEAQHRQKSKTEAVLTRRYNLLKIILHMICLLRQTEEQATLRERKELSEASKTFIKTGALSHRGETLLHMACDADTSNFHSGQENPFTSFVFPALEVVQALLDAGCDVNARNDKGQTALAVAREQEGHHSEIISILMAAGAD